ncbi:MAG: sodium:dicarboxylate symporter [Ignavibacteria bacterium RBG_13_36_8]|nr:MAG: sodium:dicarboxylate symporter [Ignavibacteria bacterium RBG_13_36_8]
MKYFRDIHFGYKTIHIGFLLLGVFAAALVFIFFDFGIEKENTELMAAIAVLVSVWWITEAIPLSATALVPLVLFPTLGILSGEATASAYVNSTIFLFMGGFIIAIAMEKWNLHKRIALNLISLFGTNPSRIILGFMIAAAFISMWISNTATAVMLLPIGLAILYKIEDEFGKKKTKTFSISLMLGIAYACSIGGIATLIGTPPNLVFQRVYSITFPNEPQILFGQWMIYGVPLSFVMLIIAWFIITKIIYPTKKDIAIDVNVIREERKKLGKMSYEEKTVLIVFILTAVLWIFRKKIEIGSFVLPGWSDLLPVPNFIDDGTVAITMGLILFIIPTRSEKTEESAILDIGAFRKIPWEIILLFGGGFALADGFVKTGLSDFIGSKFQGLAGVHPMIIILAICLTITFLTELTSNTATSQIVLPILAALAVELKIEPMLLMIPATISASMAFMMPVATPPNAIVFGSERLKVHQMAKSGFWLNIIGAMLITLFSYFLIDTIF